MLYDMASRFMADELAPRYDEFEANDVVDRACWEKAGAAGLLCASMPEAYGGAGGIFAHEAAIIEAIGPCRRRRLRHRAAQRHRRALHPPLRLARSRRRNWLPRLATGELIGAIAMTEPGAGSDLQGVEDARREGRQPATASTAPRPSSPTASSPI